MTKQTRTIYKATSDALFPDNTTKFITPDKPRELNDNTADSTGFLDDENVWEESNTFQSHLILNFNEFGDAEFSFGGETVNYFEGTTDTWDLPDPSTLPGKMFLYKNLGSGQLTLTGQSANQMRILNPTTNITAQPGQGGLLHSNGTHWVKIL